MILTEYKIKDIYTTRMVPSRTTEELREWLWNSYTTKNERLKKNIDHLIKGLETAAEDLKWRAAVLGLEVTHKKPRSKRK